MKWVLRLLGLGRGGPYGDYRIVSEIARGGMSRIWKVRHRASGQVYALKVLTPETVELMDLCQALFSAEEGQIALRLEHPNVIRTLDYGRSRGNHYYIVMEYVDGPNLAKLITVEWLRVRQRRFDLVMQVGTGLAYIHAQGLIHRDFCPKNVLLAPDGTAKVIDFGLTVPASVKVRSLLARSGTASYMAPEQIRGQPLDGRADVYAFGVSAFEILTGRRPYPASPDRGRRMQDHLNIEPMRLRQAAPELPGQLEAVVAKCVEKDRDLRYKSMADVMRDLQLAVEVALRAGA